MIEFVVKESNLKVFKQKDYKSYYVGYWISKDGFSVVKYFDDKNKAIKYCQKLNEKEINKQKEIESLISDFEYYSSLYIDKRVGIEGNFELLSNKTQKQIKLLKEMVAFYENAKKYNS